MPPLVGSIRRRTVRATVDLPQPDSPTRPSVSPSPIVKLTPSTACTVPTVRRSSRLRTGKCFMRSDDFEQWRGASVMAALRVRPRASTPPDDGVPHRLQRRVFARGSARSASVAARREGAAGRQVGQRRHHAGNFGQPRVRRRRRAAGHRAGSRPSARACRDAADARTVLRRRPPRPSCPAYITMTRCAVSATTPRSWVIRINRRAELALQFERSGRGSAPGW